MPDFSDLRTEYEAAGFREFESSTSKADLCFYLSIRNGAKLKYMVVAELHDYTQFGAPEGSISASTTAHFHSPEGESVQVTLGGKQPPAQRLAFYERMFKAMNFVPKKHSSRSYD